MHAEKCMVIILEYAKGGELFNIVIEDFEKNTRCERIAKLQMYQVSSSESKSTSLLDLNKPHYQLMTMLLKGINNQCVMRTMSPSTTSYRKEKNY